MAFDRYGSRVHLAASANDSADQDETARRWLTEVEEAARTAGWLPETDLRGWLRAMAREDAVKALGRFGEALVNAGLPSGDRDVQLANLGALVSQRDAWRENATGLQAHNTEERARNAKLRDDTLSALGNGGPIERLVWTSDDIVARAAATVAERDALVVDRATVHARLTAALFAVEDDQPSATTSVEMIEDLKMYALNGIMLASERAEMLAERDAAKAELARLSEACRVVVEVLEDRDIEDEPEDDELVVAVRALRTVARQ